MGEKAKGKKEQKKKGQLSQKEKRKLKKEKKKESIPLRELDWWPEVLRETVSIKF